MKQNPLLSQSPTALYLMVVALDGVELERLGETLKGLAHVPRSSIEIDEAVERARADHPKVVIVGFDRNPAKAVELARGLNEEVPGMRLVALARDPDPDRIRAAMRAGYRDFIVLPEDASALQQLVQEAANQSLDPASGQVVAIWGAKGGAGVTLLTVNLAAELAGEERVLLADMDFGMGDAAVFLDLVPERTMVEVFRSLGRLDERLLESCVTRHPCGVGVLAQPQDPQEAEVPDADAVLRVLASAARAYPYVLVDCGTHASEQTLAAITAADRIVLVMTPEVPAVRNAWRRLRYLDQLGVDRKRLCLVVNRWTRGAPLDQADMESNLGHPIAKLLADDPKTASIAVNDGRLLRTVSRRSALARDLAALAPTLVNPPGGGGR